MYPHALAGVSRTPGQQRRCRGRGWCDGIVVIRPPSSQDIVTISESHVPYNTSILNPPSSKKFIQILAPNFPVNMLENIIFEILRLNTQFSINFVA